MPQFLFHLRSRAGILIDDEGSHYETADAAEKACVRIARGLIAADVIQGEIDLDQCIVLADSEGCVIREVPLALGLAFEHAEDNGEAARCPRVSSWTSRKGSVPRDLLPLS